MPPLTIEEILHNLGLSKETYISDDDDFQIHLARQPNSCFVNNYFQAGLLVFNEYKAIAYMCAYLSKSEDTCTASMRQA